MILLAVLRQQRRGGLELAGKRPPSKGSPAALLPRVVGLRTFYGAALASSTVILGSALLGLALWAIGLMALLPWIPLYVFEASWQYRHYRAFALFRTPVLLQLGHLSEHVVQNL